MAPFVLRSVPMRIENHWSLTPTELFERLRSGPGGLSTHDAEDRLRDIGHNALEDRPWSSGLKLLLRQLESPLLLLLVFAAGISVMSQEWVDATIVLLIVCASVGIGFGREYSAEKAADLLRSKVRIAVPTLRDGRTRGVFVDEIVPGDIVMLSAGSLVPADGVLLEATDCFLSEAMLTGESFPVQKFPGLLDPGTPLARRTNCLYLGTNVRSGSATCLVVHTGKESEFGSIAERLSLRPPETEFDRGIRQFGYLLSQAMLLLVLLVFIAHMLRGRPPIETLLFAVALAVGLSPELLPVILSINLSQAAEMMARRGVLVRRLNAIENLGSMDILCTDKTGTLTEGVVHVEGSYDLSGREDRTILELAAINSALETGLTNPLDQAILETRSPDLSRITKVGEIPFDFTRRRLSVFVREGEAVTLITKGAFHHILAVCTRSAGGEAMDQKARERLEALWAAWGEKGIRVIAVATRQLGPTETPGHEGESEMTFRGFVTFLDHPKAGVGETIAALSALGVSLKVITGDNEPVARHVAGLVGFPVLRVLTGSDLDHLHDEALWREAERTDLFVEVDPNQKERIILALKKLGHVVGFMGDGVNDAPAMHAADTSISVDQAVDVAREAADFVLLERDLEVILRGIEEGRKTFANTLKYVLTTTSANLGNMVSMAFASLYLPFLPLTAGQILLNNFLSDIPAIGFAGDRVDPELVNRPRRWDMGFIRRFMLEFGLLSSVFDILTFGLLIVFFRTTPETFRTAWFIESLLTELVIALVVRTRGPCFRSLPGRVLLGTTCLLIPATLALPYLPGSQWMGFVPIPGTLLLTLIFITALYVVAAETLKSRFYRGVD